MMVMMMVMMMMMMMIMMMMMMMMVMMMMMMMMMMVMMMMINVRMISELKVMEKHKKWQVILYSLNFLCFLRKSSWKRLKRNFQAYKFQKILGTICPQTD